MGDKNKVAELLQNCGCETPNWPNAMAALQAIRENAEEQKVFETPTFLIEDQMFLGREHLPWIRSIIAHH